MPLIWMLPLHPQVLPEPATYRKSDKELAAEYLQKHKHQRRTGIVLLIGGIGLATLGASSSDWATSGSSSLVYVGTLATLSSLPFFVSASKNKEQGNLLLRMQSAPLAGGKTRKIPTLGVQVRLGK